MQLFADASTSACTVTISPVSADQGVTHVALPVTDPGGGNSVAWIRDLTRPFVVVLIEVERSEGYAVLGPIDSGPPVGYWGYIVDPDGHNLELSYGQEVGLAVDEAR